MPTMWSASSDRDYYEQFNPLQPDEEEEPAEEIEAHPEQEGLSEEECPF